MRRRILELDAQHSRQINIADRQSMLRNLAVLLAHSGDSWFWLLGLMILWLFGTQFWREWAVDLALGVIVTAILVMAIKQVVRRRRPTGAWGSIYRKTDPHSFPSGHATRAFMLSVLVLGLGPSWLALVLLAWAPFMTLARVAMGIHYLSDVIAGALLGILMGLAILQIVA